MEVYKGNEFLSESELVTELHGIVKTARKSEGIPPVGVLTTSDRRTWGKNFEKLCEGNLLHTNMFSYVFK